MKYLSVIHREIRHLLIILTKNESRKAIRQIDEEFFEVVEFFKVDMKVLIVSVSLAAMVLYAFCDIISTTFETDVSKLERTNKRQTGSLIFCMLLYLVPVMALFSYRFQVLPFNCKVIYLYHNDLKKAGRF